MSFGDKTKTDVNRLLTMRFQKSNGTLCKMFSTAKVNGLQRYFCVLCSKGDMGVTDFMHHAKSKGHKSTLRGVCEKSSSSRVSVCKRTTQLTQLEGVDVQVIVGMEYIIEVYVGNNIESNYHCVLCDGKFDQQIIINHLTAYAHRLKYLEKNFPTTYKKITKLEKREQKHCVLETVCRTIEDYYGRLSPTSIQINDFLANQSKICERVLNGTHFGEKMGRTFDEVLDAKDEDNGLLTIFDLDESDDLESISSSREFDIPFKCTNNVLSSRDDAMSLSSISSDESIDERKYRSKKKYNRVPIESSRRNRHQIHEGRRDYRFSAGMKHHQHSENNVKFEKIQPIEKIVRSAMAPGRKCSCKRKDEPLEVSTYHNRDRSRSPYEPISYRRNWRMPLHTDDTPKIGYNCKSNRKPSNLSIGCSDSEYRFTPKVSHRMAGSSTVVSSNIRGFSADYSPIQTPSEFESDDEQPVTLISVLNSLSTFVDLLGSLGPQMIQLMTDAIAREKLGVKFSDCLLDDDSRGIVFDAAKEKLNGLLKANLVELNKRQEIDQIVKKMDILITEANKRKRSKRFHDFDYINRPECPETTNAAHLSKPKMEDIGFKYKSHDQVVKSETVFDANASVRQECLSELSEPTTLNNSNLATLIQNFHVLSDTEKYHVITRVRDIEISDPERMKCLRSEMQIDKLLVFGLRKVEVKSEIVD